ncbi:MAG: ATP-binding protein [Bacteroidetes bacterium]|jgi:hypothetical protein|nr:ATP-binding protein [Bacteroidota bacterium]
MENDYDHSKPFTPIGYTNWRNQHKFFGIKLQDRFSHIYAVGKTGTGKTTLLLNMAVDDAYKGYGVCLIEPHGDACLKLLQNIPEHRKKDVIYFDATNLIHPTGFNPLNSVPIEQRHLVASEIVLAFKKIWADNWGPRLEYILNYCILTLLEYPTSTLLDIKPLLLDKIFRNMVLQFIDNDSILSFWHNEFEGYTNTFRNEAIMPILNKVGVFNANAILKGIIGQQKGISIEEALNSEKILICNLSKGVIGEEVSRILGSLIVTTIQTTCMRRANQSEQQRKPYMVFIDECHSFITNSFATMLSEIRKFKVGLFLSHQYLEQMPSDVSSAIIGNIGTIVSFRLGVTDAKIMAEQFYPIISSDDFINLPQFNIYLKLLIDGTSSKAFSAVLNPHFLNRPNNHSR